MAPGPHSILPKMTTAPTKRPSANGRAIPLTSARTLRTRSAADEFTR